MTEDSAKTKWCPFARVEADSSAVNPSSNRTDKKENPTWSRCIGSQCMAWRELRDQTEMKIGRGKYIPTQYGEVIGGYCGLAGKP